MTSGLESDDYDPDDYDVFGPREIPWPKDEWFDVHTSPPPKPGRYRVRDTRFPGTYEADYHRGTWRIDGAVIVCGQPGREGRDEWSPLPV